MPEWQPAADIPGLWDDPQAQPRAAVPENVRTMPVVCEVDTPAEALIDGRREAETQPYVRPTAGFVLRHWRGELTLAQAYWGIGFLLTLLVIWASNAFGSWLGQANLSPVAWGIVFGCFLLILCAMTVWQLVGIWRAAGNHIKSTGRKTWAMLARVAVLIGALRAVADFSTVTWPMLSESAMLVTSRDRIPAHRLRLLRNGTELEPAGGMPFGTADSLRNLLDAAPAVKVVHLNSIGGRIGEGYQLYQLLRERNLTTYTATDCVSACTIAFLRLATIISTKARLGFTASASAASIRADLTSMPTYAIIPAAHGTPPWFINKAVSTS
jgi:hypothetical protein